ncbi:MULTISPECIES: ribonuclease P protein component [Leuconostoc]|uniref:Ribonuclease P protein component n=1 Tax=Leuconostoc pseudomesenteroides TaxID=33968 RepID=A0A1X0VBL7_LEUPS|nr:MULTISPECIES: ribonuclease P protein component [Leuconostoc]KDA47165.1 Ribonuclease P protein component [Leuconostoc pseudomesenteroides 1159]KDA49348.1 Ribonuclease P protein component [Leuconostoc pseudomesenteroides PS12]CCJ66643.1 Ribonuclease P protein component [Leuconostoc pseudomesenteroides 4882]MCT4419543.1 ribonuclease P protein component [Leuconostoc falkenbergense]MDG9744077.1 ribonuclease P protein component [Leuconostoc falkenbergense]
MRKTFRIKKPEEFQQVFNKHHSVANKYFIVYQMAKTDQKHFRVGLSVSKKVGKAHDRVWVKRRIRQSLLELKPQMPQELDLLVIARPAAAHQSQKFLKEQMIHVLKLAKILKEENA